MKWYFIAPIVAGYIIVAGATMAVVWERTLRECGCDGAYCKREHDCIHVIVGLMWPVALLLTAGWLAGSAPTRGRRRAEVRRQEKLELELQLERHATAIAEEKARQAKLLQKELETLYPEQYPPQPDILAANETTSASIADKAIRRVASMLGRFRSP